MSEEGSDGEERQHRRCLTCGALDNGCVCCHICGRLSAVCWCDKCGICTKVDQECECKRCTGCCQTELRCFCKFCEHCGRQPLNCQCDSCEACNKKPAHCLCVSCRHCYQYVLTPGSDENADVESCRCSPCTFCKRDRHFCGCYIPEDIIRGLDCHSPSVQVFRPQWVDGRNFLVLEGDDSFQAVIIPTWIGFRRRVVRHLSDLKERVFASAFMNAFRSLVSSVLSPLLHKCHDSLRPLMFRMGLSPFLEVTTPKQVRRMLDQLVNVPSNEPNLAFGLEGNDLGRYGTTCFLQIRDCHNETTYLIDVLTPGKAAFETSTAAGFTLKMLLEDPSRIKLIFDCRQDSDALFAHFEIRLAGVLDLQYMQMLMWDRCPEFRTGLQRTIQKYADLNEQELAKWSRSKNYPFYGDYSVFARRPCSERLKAYAVNDVTHLQRVYVRLTDVLNNRAVSLAFEWTQKEIANTWEKDWRSTRGRTRSDFESCWNEPLLK